MNFLNQIPLVRSTRRNHALEHATMTILANRYRGIKMMGHSNPGGFILFADVPTEIVTDAVLEARKRLREGEKKLAIHPGCGTNIAASSFLSGSAAFAVLMGLSRGKTPKWWQVLLAVIVAVPVFIWSKPLGPRLQETISTDADIADLDVTLVRSKKTKNTFIHQINTRE